MEWLYGKAVGQGAVHGDAVKQTCRTLENMKALLREAGLCPGYAAVLPAADSHH